MNKKSKFKPEIEKEWLEHLYITHKLTKNQILDITGFTRYKLDRHLAHFGFKKTDPIVRRKEKKKGTFDIVRCLRCNKEFESEDKRKFRLCERCRNLNRLQSLNRNYERFFHYGGEL